ncbi:MAG TPA: BTAD domain-containing putative transcriptional regulator [Candidatus Limnocylindrales bacterium]|nr:BTAD domain-containing putative transcriptional regulator [Candidatus Limnocylindrales bacterium]
MPEAKPSPTAQNDPSAEFRVLGPVEVVVDATPLPLGGRRQRALLAVLLTAPGRVVSADRLIDELWAGEPPDGSDITLRTYVSRLRATLGDVAAIRAAGGGYALDIEPGWIDAGRFEALLAEGETALGRRAAARAAACLTDALDLWRGTAFGELADDGVLRDEAHRLEGLRLRAIESRLEARLALGHAAELVDELEALVREYPYRERLWRHLMLALYQAGRQADALAAYRRARDLLSEQLGIEPGDELRQAQLAILRQEVPQVVPPERRHNLPAAVSSFVGRDAELADLVRIVSEARLVTLTGVGGVGKTRLALELARRTVTDYPDGAWFVDLAPLADPALLAGHLASALEVREHTEANSIEQLGHRLRDRDLLLVLDNCEHLRDGAAELAAGLLAAAPDLRILATGREPLGIEGEVTYLVPPLGLPADPSDPDAARSSDAVALFLGRARASRPTLAQDDASLVAAARICAALDGLPLAMELAAARAKALSLGEIDTRLHDRFRFLVSSRRLAAARHRTLREAMDWSYDLLADDERRVLAQLSVFAGGFDLRAVAGVCFGGHESTALDLVTRLVDVSLVVAREGPAGMRYELLETVRQYGAERLQALGDEEATRAAHARYYLDLIESANLSPDDAGRGPQTPRLIEPEEANVRAALEWALAHDSELGLRMALGLEQFWVTRDPSEADRWLGALIDRADSADPVLLARAIRDYGSMAHVLGDFDRAEERYLRSRELFAAAAHERGVAEMTFRLGIVARRRGDLAKARRDGDESLAVFQRLGDRVGEVQVLSHLALLEFAEGNLDRGFEVLDGSIAMVDAIGWTWWQVQNLGIAARWHLEAGRVAEGESHARECLRLAVAIGDRTDVVRGLTQLAWAAAERGDLERAGVLWAAAEAEAASVPIAAWGAGWAALAPTVVEAAGPATPLGLGEAVAFALSEPDPA